jgi:hypothetical protein
LQLAVIVEVIMLGLLKDNHRVRLGATKRLLGSILVDGEFVTPQDLEAAVAQQKQTNSQLGETLVRMGVLDPAELTAVLSIQKDLAAPETAVKIAGGVRLLLGEMLLKARRITSAQLDYALMEQRQTGEKLGETLVRLNILKEHELDTVLLFQRNLGGEGAVSDKLRLGELLVATGQVTRAQLEDVLERQKLSQKKIGELLIEAGYAKPDQIDQGLKLQQKLVTAALVAALSLSTMVGTEPAHAAGSSAEAKIGISARVLERTRMTVLDQAQELVVTNADISRGYVEIPAATRISVKSNNPAGYLLAFEAANGADSLFQSVNVFIGGREVQLSPTGGGWVPQPYVRGEVTQYLSYRFALSRDARPGTYHWPLLVSALSR